MHVQVMLPQDFSFKIVCVLYIYNRLRCGVETTFSNLTLNTTVQSAHHHPGKMYHRNTKILGRQVKSKHKMKII